MLKTTLLAAALSAVAVLPAAAAGSNGGYGNGGGYVDDAGPGYRGGPGYGSPGYHGPDRFDRLSPRQLSRTLRYKGFYNVNIVDQRGPVTIVRASARGRDMILVVDARSGDVLRQRPANGWHSDRGWNGGWGDDWRRW